jgi:hypothetical protein
MMFLYCASYWLKASQFHSSRVQTRNQTSAGAKRPKEVQEGSCDLIYKDGPERLDVSNT